MTLVTRTISSENLKTFLVSQGVPPQNIMLLGSEWECAEPDDLDDALAPSVEEMLASLQIQKPSGDAFLLPLPFCVQYAAIAQFVLMLTSIRMQSDCSKAFGMFGYIPKQDVPLHVLCWAVHTRPDRSLYLVFREPQRQLKLVNLSPTEINSCVALFAC